MSGYELRLKYPKTYPVNRYLSSLFKKGASVAEVLASARERGHRDRRSLSLSVLEGMLEEDIGEICNRRKLIRYLADERNYEAAASRHAKIANALPRV
ncbi:MAG: hypothetical protein FD138_3897 [Planctomycetota bacterium]|nr:MAG: hypothetical protein FD138_3897 [Planctomycetota bacterium]